MTAEISAELKEKAKGIRLLATDMDGTLLAPDGKISERTRETVLRAMQQGYYFTFATGRQADILWQFADVIPVNAPLICSNGGEVVSYKNGQIETVHRRVCFGNTTLYKLVRFCFEQGMHFVCRRPTGELATPNCPYIPLIRSRQQRDIDNGRRMQTLDIISDPTDELLAAGDFIKLLVWPNDETQDRMLRDYAAANPKIGITSAIPGILEIVPAGAEKSEGIAYVCEMLGISMQQCCVFGDFENDVPMFQAAGMCVAMGNGKDCVKEIADYITCTNAEDGVAAAIETLFL
ncbi:MAG: HAD family phosphatase [Oscillospiraceae bacterium]|nr:HAD family phosphatase [Oscillospiraceae bacterium]